MAPPSPGAAPGVGRIRAPPAAYERARAAGGPTRRKPDAARAGAGPGKPRRPPGRDLGFFGCFFPLPQAETNAGAAAASSPLLGLAGVWRERRGPRDLRPLSAAASQPRRPFAGGGRSHCALWAWTVALPGRGRSGEMVTTPPDFCGRSERRGCDRPPARDTAKCGRPPCASDFP